jgi:hypothetical protein
LQKPGIWFDRTMAAPYKGAEVPIKLRGVVTADLVVRMRAAMVGTTGTKWSSVSEYVRWCLHLWYCDPDRVKDHIATAQARFTEHGTKISDSSVPSIIRVSRDLRDRIRREILRASLESPETATTPLSHEVARVLAAMHGAPTLTAAPSRNSRTDQHDRPRDRRGSRPGNPNQYDFLAAS